MIACLLAAGSASADATPQEQALATTLFKEAKALLDAGKVPEACRKLEESQRIYPAGGTLLNLAVCHEREGKTATAWAEFREARVIAQHDQRDDRITLAESHMKTLEPKLSKLVVVVAPAVDVPSIEVTIDGHAVKRPAWGTQAPVDPGEHIVEASAPGKKRWSARVTVAPDGDVKTIAIGPWEDAPATPAPEPTPPVTTTPPVVRVDSPTTTTPAPPPRSRAPAIIAGVVGIGGVAMGSYFGLRAIAKHDDSTSACTGNPCGTSSVSYNSDAKTAADVSTVAFIVGAVGVGLGAYLWFSGGSSESAPARTVRLAPTIAPGRGALSLSGTF